jgi:hypothetical protein
MKQIAFSSSLMRITGSNNIENVTEELSNYA